MSPHVLLAVELEGQADGGASEGTYIEVGVEPGLAPVGAMTVTFPINVGMSLNNYYEDGAGQFNDTFGFFEVGVAIGLPLPMPEGYGDWSLAAGVKIVTLGDYLTSLNGDSGSQPVGYGGFSIDF